MNLATVSIFKVETVVVRYAPNPENPNSPTGLLSMTKSHKFLIIYVAQIL